MIAVLAALAAPPEGVDPDDLDRWEGLAASALDGPAGCWEFEGGAAVSARLLSKAALWRRSSEVPFDHSGTWSGRLEGGTWTAFRIELRTPSGEAGSFPIYPVIGKIDGSIVEAVGVEQDDEDEEAPEAPAEGEGVTISLGSDGASASAGSSEAISLLRNAIDAWDTSTAISHGRWVEEGRYVLLTQEVPIDDRPNAPTIVTTTGFPEGDAFAARVAAVFPRRVTVGEWPVKVRIFDAQFHLAQQRMPDGQVLPGAETMSAVGTALGFTAAYEQRLDYRTARPCSP